MFGAGLDLVGASMLAPAALICRVQFAWLSPLLCIGLTLLGIVWELPDRACRLFLAGLVLPHW